MGWRSPAYRLGPDDPKLLTTDDNWATVQQRTGRLSAAEIAAHPRSHAITGWLGADAAAAATRDDVQSGIEWPIAGVFGRTVALYVGCFRSGRSRGQ